MDNAAMSSQQQRQKQIDRFHRILGEYVAGTVRVEFQLKRIAAEFFRVARGPLDGFFQAWVLERLTLAQKIELVENILFFALPDDRKREKLKSELRRMKHTRNELAHSLYLQVSVAGDEEGTFLRLPRSNDRDLGMPPKLDLEKLEAEIAAFPELVGRLNALWSLIHIRPPGEPLAVQPTPEVLAERLVAYKTQRLEARAKLKNRSGNRRNSYPDSKK